MLDGTSGMRIVTVNTLERGGGAEAIALSLHRGFRARGHEAEFLTARATGREPGVREIRNDEPFNRWERVFWGAARPFDSLAGRVRGAGRVAKYLRTAGRPMNALADSLGWEKTCFPGSVQALVEARRSADVLHCHNLHGDYFDLRGLGVLAGGPPTVMTLHDEWLLTGHCALTVDCPGWRSGCGGCPDLARYPAVQRDATRRNWKAKRRALGAANVVLVAPSDWLARRARTAFEGTCPVTVIRHGVDTAFFSPGSKVEARNRLGLDARAVTVLFSAHNEFKDVPTALGALETILPRPDAANLVFVGIGHPRDRVGREFGRGRLLMWGRSQSQEEMRDLYLSADVFLLASRTDNAPVSILEAISTGTPVVATDVGGIPEMVEPEFGRLVSPNSVEDVGKALAEILGSRPLRDSMSAAARARAVASYGSGRMIEDYLKLFGSLLTRDGRILEA